MRCVVDGCGNFLPNRNGRYECICGAHYLLEDGKVVEFEMDVDGGSISIGGIQNVSGGHVNVSPGNINVSGMRLMGKAGKNNFSATCLGALTVLVFTTCCILLFFIFA